jgi:hypothetical protein
LRLVELLPADGSARDQCFEPLHLLCPVLHVGLDRRSARFGASYGCFLFVGLDLNEWRAERDAVSRLHEDAGDDPLDLGLHG